MATPASSRSRCRLLARAATQMLPCSARFAHVMHAVTTAVLRLWGCNVRAVASVVLWLWACITRVVTTAVLLWGWYFSRVSCVSCCAHPALPAPGRNWGATTHRRSCLAVQKKRSNVGVVQTEWCRCPGSSLSCQCSASQCNAVAPLHAHKSAYDGKQSTRTNTHVHAHTHLVVPALLLPAATQCIKM